MEKPFTKSSREPKGIPVKAQKWLALMILGLFAVLIYGCSSGCANIMYHVHYKSMIEKDQLERSIRLEQQLSELLKK